MIAIIVVKVSDSNKELYRAVEHNAQCNKVHFPRPRGGDGVRTDRAFARLSLTISVEDTGIRHSLLRVELLNHVLR